MPCSRRASRSRAAPLARSVRRCCARTPGLPAEPLKQIDIVKIFDNLYYFGFNTVGAWAIPTSQGIILIDSLNTVKEAEEIIEPALKKVGLNPADVKMIIVGHGHADHFGGAPYFQQKYGSHVAMSKVDWDMIEKPNPNARGPQANRPLPKRDVEVVSDGQKITLGRRDDHAAASRPATRPARSPTSSR